MSVLITYTKSDFLLKYWGQELAFIMWPFKFQINSIIAIFKKI
jgi:hypothetical protein